MKAMRLHKPQPVDRRPLLEEEVPLPEPGPGEVRVRVRACAVCTHDLDVVEGRLPTSRLPLTPGHLAVGRIEAYGERLAQFRVGQRVGLLRLAEGCGVCSYCVTGQAHLCPEARWIGQHRDGGYAEAVVVPYESTCPLPETLADAAAAALLAAGNGMRALRLSGAGAGAKVGIYGLSLAARLALQVARARDCTIYAWGEPEPGLARGLGATWAGGAEDEAPAELDAALVFEAAWAPLAVHALRPGGTLVLAELDPAAVPPLDHVRLLAGERVVRSALGLARPDLEELLRLTFRSAPILPTQPFALSQANEALLALRRCELTGVAVLMTGEPDAAQSQVMDASRVYLHTGAVARLVGVHPNTVRNYEQWGFIPPVPRTPSGYRLFSPRHVALLRLAITALSGPYPGGKKLVLDLVRRAVSGDLGGALELAYARLGRVRAERAQAEAAVDLLQRWAGGAATDATAEPQRIGAVARLLGVTHDMLRSWERNGLIDVPRDRQSGYRQFGAAEIGRLRVIRLLRGAGYSVMAILRMLRHLDRGAGGDLRYVLDTPAPDEDIFSVADRWLSTLAELEQISLDTIAQLQEMMRSA